MWRYVAAVSVTVCISAGTASARQAHEVFRISRPAVDRAYSVLPNVSFEPGDIVLVHAGGCVNVSGNTPMWRDYVRPTGDDSDRLFTAGSRYRARPLAL